MDYTDHKPEIIEIANKLQEYTQELARLGDMSFAMADRIFLDMNNIKEILKDRVVILSPKEVSDESK